MDTINDHDTIKVVPDCYTISLTCLDSNEVFTLRGTWAGYIYPANLNDSVGMLSDSSWVKWINLNGGIMATTCMNIEINSGYFLGTQNGILYLKLNKYKKKGLDY